MHSIRALSDGHNCPLYSTIYKILLWTNKCSMHCVDILTVQCSHECFPWVLAFQTTLIIGSNRSSVWLLLTMTLNSGIKIFIRTSANNSVYKRRCCSMFNSDNTCIVSQHLHRLLGLSVFINPVCFYLKICLHPIRTIRKGNQNSAGNCWVNLRSALHSFKLACIPQSL